MDDDEIFGPPKIPEQLRMIWPVPSLHHSAGLPDMVEAERDPVLFPLANVDDATVRAEYVERQVRRKKFPSEVIDKIVYDAVEPSPFVGKRKKKKKKKQDKSSETIDLPIKESQFGQLPPWYVPKARDKTLVFESRFESGNLRRAVQIYDFEYDLIAKPDMYTSRHTQWFFFSVTNALPNRRYTFNIINMLKSDSLFNDGMQPLMFSVESNQGWVRCGEKIVYTSNDLKHDSGNFYTVTFTVTMPDTTDNDTIYFAYCYPYTYTDLKRYLHTISAAGATDSFMRTEVLCKTLSGNSCPLLTITNFETEPSRIQLRRGIVITARVHPGETNASWMMKGVIDYLCSDTLDAKILRDNFVFKIVPMLNIDGVVCGNYRCNLAGVDLNRQYLDPSQSQHPTIYHLRKMVKEFQAAHNVLMAVDLHGHSRQKNVFMYGCCDKEPTRVARIRGQIFPKMLAKNADIFSFEGCNFAVQKSKSSTARVVYWRQHGIANSFTIEASFAGANIGRYKGFHFDTCLLERVGHHFCDTILDYCDPDQSNVDEAYRQVEAEMPFELLPSKRFELDLDIGSDSDSNSADEAAEPKAVRKKVTNATRKVTKKRRKLKAGKKRITKNSFKKQKPPLGLMKVDARFALHRLMVEDGAAHTSAKAARARSVSATGLSLTRRQPTPGRKQGSGGLSVVKRKGLRNPYRAASAEPAASQGTSAKPVRRPSSTNGSGTTTCNRKLRKSVKVKKKVSSKPKGKYSGLKIPIPSTTTGSNKVSAVVPGSSKALTPASKAAAAAAARIASPRSRKTSSPPSRAAGRARMTAAQLTASFKEPLSPNARDAMLADADFLAAIMSPGTLALLKQRRNSSSNTTTPDHASHTQSSPFSPPRFGALDASGSSPRASSLTRSSRASSDVRGLGRGSLSPTRQDLGSSLLFQSGGVCLPTGSAALRSPVLNTSPLSRSPRNRHSPTHADRMTRGFGDGGGSPGHSAMHVSPSVQSNTQETIQLLKCLPKLQLRREAD